MGHIVDSCPLTQLSDGLWDSTRLMMTQSTGWKPWQQQHTPNN